MDASSTTENIAGGPETISEAQPFPVAEAQPKMLTKAEKKAARAAATSKRMKLYHARRRTKDAKVIELAEGKTVEPVPVVVADAAPVPALPPGMTMEMFMEGLKLLGGTMGAELRRGNPEDEVARNEQKIRMEAGKMAERQVVKEAETIKANNQAYCESMGHKQDGGRANTSAVSGQVTSDGMYTTICVSCQKVWKRAIPQNEMAGVS